MRSNSVVAKDYKTVNSLELFEELLEHIDKYDYHAFDVETTGLDVHEDIVIGYGICGKAGQAYYVPIYWWDVLEQELKKFDWEFDTTLPLRKLKDILTWNGSYDIQITKNDLGIDLLNNLASEVMLMKHTLQEEGPFKLKESAIEEQHNLGLDVEKAANEEQLILKENIEKNGGKATKTNYELYKADMPIIATYCCADVDLTFRLHELYYDRLEEEGLWEFFYIDEVMPLYKEVTIPMEAIGVRLDLPLIEKVDKEIQVDIAKYKETVIEGLKKSDGFDDWVESFAAKKFPVKKGGSFGNKLAEVLGLPFPKSEKTGKYSITKKTKELIKESHPDIYAFYETEKGKEPELSKELTKKVQRELLSELTEGNLISINSKQQMADLVFGYLGVKPIGKKGKSGHYSFTESTTDEIADKYGFDWAKDLQIYNKLAIKIKPTYIDRFYQNHKDGYFYFNYKQHGTISGRYGSDAQQIPRPMEEGEAPEIIIKYVNQLRKFFIAREGHVFIDDDYESLEPHVFAHVSTDERLRDIFRKGHDFYSSIAIPTEGLTGVSADKKADNYLGKVDKTKRQAAKKYALGIVYGLGDYALSKDLEISQEEAQEKIDNYLNGFPDLAKWMKDSERMAKTLGYVKTQTGRIRHLPKVKELYERHGDKLLDYKYRNKLIHQKKATLGKEEANKLVTGWYLDYKNGLNNAKNVQIQGLAGSIVNRAMIAVVREFKKRGIKGVPIAQVHDQAIFEVPEEVKELSMEIVQDKMENITKLSVDLKAIPELANNWADGH